MARMKFDLEFHSVTVRGYGPELRDLEQHIKGLKASQERAEKRELQLHKKLKDMEQELTEAENAAEAAQRVARDFFEAAKKAFKNSDTELLERPDTKYINHVRFQGFCGDNL